MSRFVLFLGSVLLLVGQAVAAPSKTVKTGTLKVAFGYVTDESGVKIPIQGVEFPYSIEKIDVTKISKKRLGGKQPRPNPALKPVAESLLYAFHMTSLAAMLPTVLFDTTIYMADANTIYGVFEEPNPSALDDLQLAGGVGQPWKHLTFGFGVNPVPAMFQVRWRCYANMVTGQGPGVSAFNQEFADFGVNIPGTMIPGGQPGHYKLTINVQAAGAVSPSSTVYVASQFRVPTFNGEGAFDHRVTNIFNHMAPPTVGSSENLFYYDSDPEDGIYAENEVEQVSEGLSNLLFGIVAGGTVDTLSPFQFSIVQGALVGGEIVDCWFSDNSYIRATPRFDLDRLSAPLQYLFEGGAASSVANNITFLLESAASAGGGTVKIQLYNYTTSSFDEVDSRPITALDSVTQIIIATNPTRYIHPTTRRMQARIDFFPPIEVDRNWTARVDQIQWRITRP